MQCWHVQASKLNGTLRVPPSKSHSIRALLFAAVAEGESVLEGLLDSPDVHAAMRICRQLGAQISGDCHHLVVRGVAGIPQVPDDVLDVGNSGQLLRFVAALASLSDGYTVLTGDASVRSQRPVQPLINGLEQLGAFAVSARNDGKAPLIVRGPLRNWDCCLSGEDSQPVSGLMMAAALRNGISQIRVKNLGERPWIELTLDWLRRFGVQFSESQPGLFEIHGTGRIEGFNYTVPGDWSSAAFPLAAALLTGSRLIIEGLDREDVQGDKGLVPVLQSMGASMNWTATSALEVFPSELTARSIDVNSLIDAVPVLSVLAALAQGETRLYNGAIARAKECDRLTGMAQALSAMGIGLSEEPDGLTITGGTLRGAVLNSHSDHRLALAFAVAGLATEEGVRIEGIDCVAKSYPHFVEDMRGLGAVIETYAMDTDWVHT